MNNTNEGKQNPNNEFVEMQEVLSLTFPLQNKKKGLKSDKVWESLFNAAIPEDVGATEDVRRPQLQHHVTLRRWPAYKMAQCSRSLSQSLCRLV
jgi:hypothetical protein